MQQTLSAIVPNFNHGRLLRRAIAALLEQDRKPDEIIIVDDASTDDSREIIATLAAGSSLVRVLANDANLGVMRTLTRGIEASTGAYIYLAAADDWVLPGFFSAALQLLVRYPQAGLACGEANLMSGDTGEQLGMRPAARPSRRESYLPPAVVAAKLRTSDNWILTGSAVLVRERVLAAGGLLPQLDSFADGYLMRKLALTHGFCYLPRPVATWRVFSRGISRRMASDPARAEAMLARVLAQFAADACFPPWYGELFVRRWHFAVARLAILAKPINSGALIQTIRPGRHDKCVVAALCAARPSAWVRPLLLTWLWFRLRPTSLAAVMLTFLGRRIGRAPEPI